MIRPMNPMGATWSTCFEGFQNACSRWSRWMLRGSTASEHRKWCVWNILHQHMKRACQMLICSTLLNHVILWQTAFTISIKLRESQHGTCSRFNWWTSTTSSGLALSWSFLGVRRHQGWHTLMRTWVQQLVLFPLQDSQAEASFLSTYKAPVKGYLLPWQWMVPLWSSMQVYLNRFITPHDISTQPDTGKSHWKLQFAPLTFMCFASWCPSTVGFSSSFLAENQGIGCCRL